MFWWERWTVLSAVHG